MKRAISIILAFAVLFSSMAVTVSAESDFVKKGRIVLEEMLFGIVNIIDVFLPGTDWYGGWQKKEEYTPECFYEGNGSDGTVDGTEWSVGYGENSLLDGMDVINKEGCYVPGNIAIAKGRVVTEIIDDQRVRAFAVSDGANGTVVYAVIDGYGIARGTVMEIRKQFEDFAKENEVVSVNVSALHQHSGVDTLGTGVPLLPAFFNNVAVNLLGLDESHLIRKSVEFMENLKAKTVDAMKQAVNSMEDGTLSYGYANIKEYLSDHREPYVFDENIHRLRFVPYNENSRETWICSAGYHCTTYGVRATVASADSPYYIEKELEQYANLVFINGAEGSIYTDEKNTRVEGASEAERAEAFGRRLGEIIRGIDNDKILEPKLSVKHKEVYVGVENPILKLAARQGLTDNIAVKLPWHRYEIVTEIGYMEFGGKVGVLMVPGEPAPELLYGGALTAQETDSGKNWDMAPIADLFDAETVICYGLCNDLIGYIFPDNEYKYMFKEDQEISTISRSVGSVVAESFKKLSEGCKKSAERIKQ